MAYRCDILLGRITRVSGFEGAVTVKIEKLFTENIPQMESVFLEIEGRPVPFFISDMEYNGADILKLGFEGYESDEKMNEFIGCRIFLTSDTDIRSLKEESQNFMGYKVFADDGILLGSISEIISNKGQWLINVASADRKSILIPFHEHFIVSIDKQKKIIIMNIPEGLTEINVK